MSWLFIDTHKMNEMRLGILDGDASKIEMLEGRSRVLLLALQQLDRQTLAGLDGVCVVAGPGSFSSLRSGVLTANLFARLFKCRLVSVRANEAVDLDTLAARLSRSEFSAMAFAAPMYGAEPNITK